MFPISLVSTVEQYLRNIYPEGINSSELAAALNTSEDNIMQAARVLENQDIAKVRKTGKFHRLMLRQTAARENAPPERSKPNKPFTPNPTRGYEVQNGKVKIFLDRKACSKTLTLTIADLTELVNAVQKAA